VGSDGGAGRGLEASAHEGPSWGKEPFCWPGGRWVVTMLTTRGRPPLGSAPAAVSPPGRFRWKGPAPLRGPLPRFGRKRQPRRPLRPSRGGAWAPPAAGSSARLERFGAAGYQGGPQERGNRGLEQKGDFGRLKAADRRPPSGVPRCGPHRAPPREPGVANDPVARSMGWPRERGRGGTWMAHDQARPAGRWRRHRGGAGRGCVAGRSARARASPGEQTPGTKHRDLDCSGGGCRASIRSVPAAPGQHTW
jgi:hypothetical protein